MSSSIEAEWMQSMVSVTRLPSSYMTLVFANTNLSLCRHEGLRIGAALSGEQQESAQRHVVHENSS